MYSEYQRQQIMAELLKKFRSVPDLHRYMGDRLVSASASLP